MVNIEDVLRELEKVISEKPVWIDLFANWNFGLSVDSVYDQIKVSNNTISLWTGVLDENEPLVLPDNAFKFTFSEIFSTHISSLNDELYYEIEGEGYCICLHVYAK